MAFMPQPEALLTAGGISFASKGSKQVAMTSKPAATGCSPSARYLCRRQTKQEVMFYTCMAWTSSGMQTRNA